MRCILSTKEVTIQEDQEVVKEISPGQYGESVIMYCDEDMYISYHSKELYDIFQVIEVINFLNDKDIASLLMYEETINWILKRARKKKLLFFENEINSQWIPSSTYFKLFKHPDYDIIKEHSWRLEKEKV